MQLYSDWVHNTVTVCTKTERMSGKAQQLQSLYSRLSAICGHNAGTHLSDGKTGVLDALLPMPDTYRRYDTTYIRREDVRVGNSLRVGDVRSPSNGYVVLTPPVVSDVLAHFDEQERLGAVGWMEWRLRNWGTHTDTYALEMLDKGRKDFSFRLCTYLSHPAALCRKLTEEYPGLRMHMESEYGNGRVVSAVFSNGMEIPVKDCYESDRVRIVDPDLD